MKFEIISEKEAPRIPHQYGVCLSKEELYNMYWNKKMNTTQIADKLGYHPGTIWNMMKEYNIPRRSIPDAHMKYFINKDFFKVWTHDMAYVLGEGICADGNIYIGERAIHFRIFSNDKELLEDIICVMQSNHPINKDKRYDNAYYIDICSVEMVQDLLNLGITPNKSLTLEFPDVPKEYLPSFLRGVFDGDGSVFPIKGKNSIGVDISSGSDRFVIDLQTILNDIGIKSSLIRRDGELSGVYIWKRSHKKFYEFIYHHDGIHLKRKKDIFDKFFGGENAR